MDLTAAIAGLNFPLFTPVALFFHNYAYSLVAILSLLTFPSLRGKNRYFALAYSMVLVLALALLLKDIYAIPRPCNSWLDAPKACLAPDDYAFPSGHTAFAFVFVAASLGTGIFPVYLALGALIAFSRVYLGVHSVADIGGGAVLGLLTYFFVEELLDYRARSKLKGGKKDG
jgi:membrane-associated phospholipid phosphatase